MESFQWLKDLFTTNDSVAHIALLYAIVIAVGVYLGKIKIFGISLGVTFVLFAGILAGHIGFTAPTPILTFVQDFGLILFVFMIGMQVGPGFFESFGTTGIKLNGLAAVGILLNILVMFACYYIFFDTSNPTNLPMMVGTLYGAVTNTPGLGAANEALTTVFPNGAPQIASAYACAYPLGVLGIIGATILIRYICKVKLDHEEEQLAAQEEGNANKKPYKMHLEVTNKYLEGKTLLQVHDFLNRDFVVSRLVHQGELCIPNRDTIFHLGDQMLIVCAEADHEAIMAFIGPKLDIDFEQSDQPLVSKRILITNPSINGKSLGSMHFSSVYGVNVTRVTRHGMDLFASASLPLQVGDRIMVVGPEDAVDRVTNKMGNSVRRLNAPNIATIFVGIFLGLIFGSFPLAIPGMPVREARPGWRPADHRHPHRPLRLQDPPGDLYLDLGQHDAARDRPGALLGIGGHQGGSRLLRDSGTGRRTALRADGLPHHGDSHPDRRPHRQGALQVQLLHHRRHDRGHLHRSSRTGLCQQHLLEGGPGTGLLDRLPAVDVPAHLHGTDRGAVLLWMTYIIIHNNFKLK